MNPEEMKRMALIMMQANEMIECLGDGMGYSIDAAKVLQQALSSLDLECDFEPVRKEGKVNLRPMDRFLGWA